MNDFYQKMTQARGSFSGTTLLQARGEVGGFRHVFVSLAGPKIGVMYPISGGILKNPFKGTAKAYAADLVEYKPNGECYILKTYEVADGVLESAVKVKIASGKCKNGEVFRHIPFVGDNLMVAPETLDGTGTAVTVTAVTNTYAADGKQDGWEITLSSTLGALSKGAVLVEASKAGSNVKPMVTNPNCYLDHDYDFIFNPATGDEDFDGARYFFTPVLMENREYAYIDRMQPLPKSILALNTSKVEGWFKL